MIQRIKLLLEYGADPIWIEEEDGCEIDEIPPEGLLNQSLVKMNEEIGDTYTSLFINNEKEFSYIGFPTEEEAHFFAIKLRMFSALVKKVLGDIYIIEDLLPYDMFDHPERYPEG